MDTKEQPRPPFRRKYFILIIYFFVAALILLAFTTYPGFNWYDKDMFADMVYGKAYKPFVYRTLIPSTVRFITEITPQILIDKIESFARGKWLMQEMIYIAGMDEEYIYEYMIALFIMLLCFVGFAYSLRRLIQIHYNFPDFVADLIPVGALALIPAFFRYYNQLYDPATLFLFAFGLVMVSRRKHVWYYAIYILAAFNKETAPLLAIPFIFMEWNRISKIKLFTHLGIQFIIWLGIKSLVSYIYMGNPGLFITFNFFNHTLTMLTRPFPLLYMLLAFAVFGKLIVCRWRDKPLFLRRSFLVSFIILTIAGMLFGVFDELRIFYEVYPLACLLIIPSLNELFNIAPVQMKIKDNS